MKAFLGKIIFDKILLIWKFSLQVGSWWIPFKVKSYFRLIFLHFMNLSAYIASSVLQLRQTNLEFSNSVSEFLLIRLGFSSVFLFWIVFSSWPHPQLRAKRWGVGGSLLYSSDICRESPRKILLLCIQFGGRTTTFDMRLL